ncbi:MAG TPA: L-2-amino-thiazoline-4-carboxylic acid hydrolase [Spirochaetota bacterium]|nr:L-2-amino-thiazoline-4-carboxylic acid hydrolase [Spirochaetota bacterium]HPJ40027.1 L-2-amino-thiazoline-4-carboxylic acid hydrolase [Spirochaetota bacterium]HPQ54351.1 L-2-amino-thiazoline-4-carboxylic acid hydrolase [Spirochaetota bacterium]
MLKTTIDRVAQPAKPLILLGILKGYVSHPLLVMVQLPKYMRMYKKQLPASYPRDFVQVVVLMAALYTIFRKKHDRETAFSMVAALILPLGLSVQMANFRYVEAERTMEHLIAYQQRTNREGPTKLNTMEIITQGSGCYEFKVHNCMFMEAFSQLGMPELTRVMCAVDNAVFNTYLPEKIVFHRNGVGNRIVDGAPYCSFVCERKG